MGVSGFEGAGFCGIFWRALIRGLGRVSGSTGTIDGGCTAWRV